MIWLKILIIEAIPEGWTLPVIPPFFLPENMVDKNFQTSKYCRRWWHLEFKVKEVHNWDQKKCDILYFKSTPFIK